MSREVVVIDAVRTPFGRRHGALSSVHALDLLGIVQRALFTRTGVAPSEVGQVIGGCVTQAGMQSMNVTRNAWLAAGLPKEVPATTVDAQCGSSQQASTIAHALVAAGVVDVAVACGVEVMSRVPMGSTTPRDPEVGKPINRSYWAHHELTSQFEAAERLAERRGITRRDADELGKRSQDLAAAAWSAGRFADQVVPVDAPVTGGADGERRSVVVDEGLRPTELATLADLAPTGRPSGVHTAGTTSQIADGASAVLLMAREKADALGCPAMASMLGVAMVGCDPALMLEGPIGATRKLLSTHGLSIEDVDLFEINEAFAAVVLVWAQELEPDMARVNPHGGAIAMGHPLGASGTALLAKAVHGLASTDGELALVAMCCNGGLGTGTLLRRS